ncbi:hypothetical protein NL108_017631 [Boleophthalmus pectinirostris]|nr:hypothetical protein NL108_017631 [Boleophthalmus pectinirostris]
MFLQIVPVCVHRESSEPAEAGGRASHPAGFTWSWEELVWKHHPGLGAVWKQGCDFLSVTREVVSKHAEVRGRRVTVVDTPGFGAEGFTPEQQFEQLRDAMIECAPGPHAFVLVIKIGRISEVDCKLLQLLSEVFDTDLKYVTLLFTHKDRLKGRSLEELIETTPPLKELLQKCGGRYNVFNNEQRADVRQVQRLLHTVDLMHQENGRHYTQDMLAEKHTLPRGDRSAPVVLYGQRGKSRQCHTVCTTQEVVGFFTSFWEVIKCIFSLIHGQIKSCLKTPQLCCC